MNLRDVLMAIRDEYGALTPQIVLDAARDEAHPLHSRFTWDDGEAAERWRRHEAHELIRVARIKLPTGDPSEPRDVRAFQAVRGTDERTFAYEPSEEVAMDPLMRAVVLREMEREWRALQRRWETFAEFAEMIRRDIAS